MKSTAGVILKMTIIIVADFLHEADLKSLNSDKKSEISHPYFKVHVGGLPSKSCLLIRMYFFICLGLFGDLELQPCRVTEKTGWYPR